MAFTQQGPYDGLAAGFLGLSPAFLWGKGYRRSAASSKVMPPEQGIEGSLSYHKTEGEMRRLGELEKCKSSAI